MNFHDILSSLKFGSFIFGHISSSSSSWSSFQEEKNSLTFHGSTMKFDRYFSLYFIHWLTRACDVGLKDKNSIHSNFIHAFNHHDHQTYTHIEKIACNFWHIFFCSTLQYLVQYAKLIFRDNIQCKQKKIKKWL